MADLEKKERLSSEYIRSDPGSPTAPVLPTVNPAVEKTVQDTPAAKIHPAFYVMYVLRRRFLSTTHAIVFADTDHSLITFTVPG